MKHMWKSCAQLISQLTNNAQKGGEQVVKHVHTERPRLHCFLCGYDWTTRRDGFPARCPRCQRRRFWINSKQVDLPFPPSEPHYEPPEDLP